MVNMSFSAFASKFRPLARMKYGLGVNPSGGSALLRNIICLRLARIGRHIGLDDVGATALIIAWVEIFQGAPFIRADNPVAALDLQAFLPRFEVAAQQGGH